MWEKGPQILAGAGTEQGFSGRTRDSQNFRLGDVRKRQRPLPPQTDSSDPVRAVAIDVFFVVLIDLLVLSLVMGHAAGLRAGTRYAFSRGFKKRGYIPLSTYLRIYK